MSAALERLRTFRNDCEFEGTNKAFSLRELNTIIDTFDAEKRQLAKRDAKIKKHLEGMVAEYVDGGTRQDHFRDILALLEIPQ